MAVFICFAATEDTDPLLIIFGEVSKSDVNESGINQAFFFFDTHTTSCSTRCSPLGRALNST